MQYSGITLTPGFIMSAATDPQYNYVTALLHGDGTNAGTNNTFLDSSPNNLTLTRNGTPTQGTFTPYGTLWSNYLKTGDKLTAAASSAFDLSGSTWTIEFWMYSLATPTSGNECRLLMAGSNGDIGGWDIGYDNPGTISFFRPYSASPGITSSVNIALNTWYHVAIVCNAGSAYIYFNGTQVAGPVTISRPSAATQTLRIGYDDVGTVNFQYNGYISNLRIVKGTAVYTAAFTPPTAPLTAITNTSFLSCQSNRFKDNSTNNLTITPTATPSAQVYSPFGTTTQYDPTVISGSGYFNGSTDYLSIANNAVFTISGDFTLEMWLYPTAVSGVKGLFGQRASEAVYSPILIELNGATINFYVSTSGSAWVVSLTGAAIAANTWTHVALVRSGTTVTYYINGVAGGTTGTATGALMTPISPIYIGLDAGTPATAGYFPGYISNVRIVNGTAVYTSNFTPPTAPLPAIANTSLLLNYINGQIYDSGMMNNFVTVGTAQISTSVVKYGTGSIYFDGTGSYLSTPSKPNFSFGTGDFTIEGWVYLSSATGAYRNIISIPHSSGELVVRFGNSASYNSYFQVSVLATAASNIYSTNQTQTALLNQWVHFAFTRSSSTCRVFLNGVLQNIGTGAPATVFGATSFSDSTNITSSGTVAIGDSVGNNIPFIGYMDELRITNGYARYTANFTPPTSIFPSTGNIQSPANAVDYLVVGGGGGAGSAATANSRGGGGGGAGGLLAGSSSISTGTTYTVTVGAGGNGTSTLGNPGSVGSNSSVTFFNPLTYAASFNGTNQYLTTPSNAAFQFGTGNFTIEGWFYVNSIAPASQSITAFRSGDSLATIGWGLLVIGNQLYFGPSDGTTAYNIYHQTTLSVNTWYHAAAVRSGTVINLYLNGVAGTSPQTVSAGYTINGSGPTVYVGYASSGSTVGLFNGYISNLRIVKGVAVYTSTFTPPLSPLTSIQSANTNGAGSAAITGTQTSLLTLQNASIVDNSVNLFTITNNNSVTTSQTISPLATVLAYGGGAGGSSSSTSGTAGGSGGGGSIGGSGGPGTSSQGNAGGGSSAVSTTAGGGGGGSGGAGQDNTAGLIAYSTGANGGAGTVNSITGTAVTYAAGGAGGIAGGGSTGATGAANTGNGGGGGGNPTGGAGGSGVVILRFPTSNILPAITTGSPTLTTPSGYNVYTWTSSGSITF